MNRRIDTGFKLTEASYDLNPLKAKMFTLTLNLPEALWQAGDIECSLG